MPDNTAGAPTNAPSLAVAINKYAISLDYPYPIEDHPGDPAKQKESIKKVLENIWLNLDAVNPEAALEGAWSAPEGNNPFAPKPPGLEERWARLVTERLACTPYNGPGQLYLGNYTHDSEVLELFQRDDDPACSLVFACQQLSSMGTMSRGFTMDGFYNAGGSQQGILDKLTVKDPATGTTRAAKGKWYPGGQDLLWGTACYKKEWFGPGAVWAADGRNKGDPAPGPNKGGAHILFMLRSHPDARSFQVFDTGAARAPVPEQPCPRFRLPGTSRGIGNYDYGWADHVVFTHPDVFQGLGVLPPEDQAQSLAFGIRRLRRARPMGFARLVLHRRTGQFNSNGVETPGEILFASPMLLMHQPDEPEKNYSISRLMWSLRMIYGLDWLKWTWVVYVPTGKLAETVIKQSGRSWSLSSTLDNCYEGGGDLSKIPADWHTKRASCILFLSSWCDRITVTKKVWDGKKHVNAASWEDQPGSYKLGTVAVEAMRGSRSSSIPGTSPFYSLPWNRPSGTVQLTEEDFEDFPYFKGDWDGQ